MKMKDAMLKISHLHFNRKLLEHNSLNMIFNEKFITLNSLKNLLVHCEAHL